ncbi:MAG: 4-hydroxy-tetrahydrodipicolinate reductase [Thermomicrobiales bacterium]
MSALRLAIAGAGGRMGRQVLSAALAADPPVAIHAGFVRPGSALAGTDLGTLAGGNPLGISATTADQAADALAGANVLVDFSRAGATVAFAETAAARGLPFLTGTSGLSDEQLAAVRACADRIPVLIAPNTSLGLTALLHLLPTLVRALGPDYDLEIIETHHRHKVDAPSGTALAIGAALAAARDHALSDHARYGREGIAPRAPGEIGIHAIRAGAAAGEHRIILASEGEQIEVLHRAVSRQTYAAGALRAAHWLAEQPPGLYSMSAVL